MIHVSYATECDLSFRFPIHIIFFIIFWSANDHTANGGWQRLMIRTKTTMETKLSEKISPRFRDKKGGRPSRQMEDKK